MSKSIGNTQDGFFITIQTVITGTTSTSTATYDVISAAATTEVAAAAAASTAISVISVASFIATRSSDSITETTSGIHRCRETPATTRSVGRSFSAGTTNSTFKLGAGCTSFCWYTILPR